MKIQMPSLSAAAFIAIAASSSAPTEGRAEIDYPCCSISSTGQSGLPVCLFSTREQCQASIGGMAGFCQRNSRLVWQEQQQMMKRGVR
jgi:Protein of unknown function (DUF3551)